LEILRLVVSSVLLFPSCSPFGDWLDVWGDSDLVGKIAIGLGAKDHVEAGKVILDELLVRG
jgi:hypothetical protein